MAREKVIDYALKCGCYKKKRKKKEGRSVHCTLKVRGARRSSQGSNERKSRANKWRSVFLGEWEIRAISCSRRDQTSGRESFPIGEGNGSERNVPIRKRRGVQMRRKYARRVYRLTLRRQPPFLPPRHTLFLFCRISHFVTSFPPRSHQLPVRGREKLQRQVGRGELVSFPCDKSPVPRSALPLDVETRRKVKLPWQ